MLNRSVNLKNIAQAVYQHGMSPEEALAVHVKIPLTRSERANIIRSVRVVKVTNVLAERMVAMTATHKPYGLVRYTGKPVGKIEFLHTKNFEVVGALPELVGKNPSAKVPKNYADIIKRMGGYIADTLTFGIASEYEAGNAELFDFPLRPNPLSHMQGGIGTSGINMQSTLLAILKQYQDQRSERPTYGKFRRCAEGGTAFIMRRAGMYIEDTGAGDSPGILHEFFDHGYDHETDKLVIGLDVEAERFDVIQPAYSEAIRFRTLPSTSIHTRCPGLVPLKPDEPNLTLAEDAIHAPILRVYTHYLDAVA